VRNDTICGLTGNDVLFGFEGADVLIGGAGSDAAFGSGEADLIRGGSGIDLLDGGSERDVLRGGKGGDRCLWDGEDDARGCFGPGSDPIVSASGDIACEPGSEADQGSCQQIATSDLLVAGNAWAVLTLGDNQYPDGVGEDFQQSYAASWGRVKAITHPAPGNHDYHVSDALGYYSYFGPSAGVPGRGYYSFDVGTWHLIALNSNCDEVGGCGDGSPQEQWLRKDLAASPSTCVLAYWHHPRFSSGEHGSSDDTDAFWRALYGAGADVVLNGHDHDYERFAPQDPDQRADPNGIRQFVVGTGGRGLRPFGSAQPNSQARSSGDLGVLELTLHEDSYDWRFVAIGGAIGDSGTGSCS
jgi:Ca2+-binding RTX toxin-like protein